MNLTLKVTITKKTVALAIASLTIAFLCVWFFFVMILGRELHFVWENMFAYMIFNAIIFLVQMIALRVIFRFFSPKETTKVNDVRNRVLSVAGHLVCISAILFVLMLHSLQIRMDSMEWQAARIHAVLTGEEIYTGLIFCVYVFGVLGSVRVSTAYRSVALHAFAVMSFLCNLRLYQGHVMTVAQLQAYDLANLGIYIGVLLLSILVSIKVAKTEQSKF